MSPNQVWTAKFCRNENFQWRLSYMENIFPVGCKTYLWPQGFLSSPGKSLLNTVNHLPSVCRYSLLIQYVQHFNLPKITEIRLLLHHKKYVTTEHSKSWFSHTVCVMVSLIICLSIKTWLYCQHSWVFYCYTNNDMYSIIILKIQFNFLQSKRKNNSHFYVKKCKQKIFSYE